MSNILYTKLPERYLSDAPYVGHPHTFIENLLHKELPKGETKTLSEDLQWQFLLDRHARWGKKPKSVRRKKTFLTRKERKRLDVLKLPKSDWNYDSLEGIRQMWRQYMRQNLELAGPAPNCGDQDWSNFSTILARSELIGSEIKVVRSQVPSHVGLNGTVVLETKMTFQVVTPQSKFKIIPKNTSVFEFVLDSLKFTVFGKHIMTRPSERSVKKIKSQMLPDL
ncbi:hypothetical protein MTP99_005660 [Tenebrio molitor]|jgi:ribonuclease P protein subunit POP4|uniref:ribonuclease P protein subunit p29 n=1 Tax=Tenebrio molitor TaxID=7067 RepID=UPI002701F87D|nr:hypothetical protein MTP99_005660 [Tenebrio molitor]